MVGYLELKGIGTIRGEGSLWAQVTIMPHLLLAEGLWGVCMALRLTLTVQRVSALIDCYDGKPASCSKTQSG
jgi:hypothetical protein